MTNEQVQTLWQVVADSGFGTTTHAMSAFASQVAGKVEDEERRAKTMAISLILKRAHENISALERDIFEIHKGNGDSLL